LPETAPKLTVAIPTYNGAAHLAETLDSILNQECGPFDLLVCDDSSDDETVNLVRERVGDRGKIVVNKQRLGLAGNWNQCMALSQTPWVNIFHQDDVMLPGHLAWVLKCIEGIEKTGESVGLIAVPVDVIDEDSMPVPESVVQPGGMGLWLFTPPCRSDFLDFSPADMRVLGTWWYNRFRCSGVVTNRAAHAQVGGFDASYRYVVDWDFWYRICRTWTVSWKRYDPSVLMRWHAASETHRFKTGTADLEEIARLLANISQQEGPADRRQRKHRARAIRSLARAFLNRSHEALHNGQTELARACLKRAWDLSSRQTIQTLGSDPRFMCQMGVLTASPRLALRLFAKNR
jgi:glycosyltransferase involved in cell wall biosynthesis